MSMDMVGGDLPEGHMSLSPPWLSFISLGASHRVQECGTLVGEDLGTASSKRVVVLDCCKPEVPVDGSRVKEGLWDQ